jgi:hypothetical protein
LRIGVNPDKDKTLLNTYGRHRVIIPVYIPNFEGYFENALEILKLCLESLRITTSGKASITIISNGSCPSVIEELKRQYETGWIDQLLINHVTRGKVNATVSVARGSFEELITISDADVFFKAGWIEAVEQIFEHFPECSFASPFFSPSGMWYYTSATILGALFRRELTRAKVVNEEDLARLAKSLGNPDMYLPEDLKKQLIVMRNGVMAGVGCGHFCFTIRKGLLPYMPKKPSLQAIGGTSEMDCFDIPPDENGFWRLATIKAYVYHMGNIPEPWHYEEFERLRQYSCPSVPGPEVLAGSKLHWTGYLPWKLRCKLVSGLRKIKR